MVTIQTQSLNIKIHGNSWFTSYFLNICYTFREFYRMSLFLNLYVKVGVGYVGEVVKQN